MTEQNISPARRGRPPRIRENDARSEPAREPVREPVRASKQRTRRGFGHDPLNIPKEILGALGAEGIDLQWNTEMILGQPDVVGTTQMAQQAWEPVQTGMFDGRLDYLMPKGHTGGILYQGLRLDWRPMELTLEAKAEEQQAARAAVRTEERKITDGQIDGVSLDTNHPSARRNTFVNKERLPSMPIPQ